MAILQRVGEAKPLRDAFVYPGADKPCPVVAVVAVPVGPELGDPVGQKDDRFIYLLLSVVTSKRKKGDEVEKTNGVEKNEYHNPSYAYTSK